MNINTLSFLNFNKNFGLQLKKLTAKNQQEKVGRDFNINSYPKNYYLNQLSFGFKSRLSADDLIAKIGEENFPNKEIVKTLKGLGNSNDFSLYDIHKEHYKDLLNCSTLEEAKQKYPEFKDVKDAKDIDYNSQHKKSILYKIGNKQISGIDINNLSLELLKKYYGQLMSPQKKEAYYNIAHITVVVLFNLLNIKKMNNTYISFASKTDESKEKMANVHKGCKLSPATKQKISNTNKGHAVSDKTRKKISDTIKKNGGRKVSPETRKKMSDTMKTKNADPEYRKHISNLLKMKAADPEYRRKNEKFWEAQRLAYKRHPEITNTMKDIAKSFTGMSSIRRKQEHGIPLTDIEEAVQLAFFKECERRMPGYKKIISDEFHKILDEWGLAGEDSFQ